MNAYIVGNGKSVADWEPQPFTYATNKFLPTLEPYVYMITSIHAINNWLAECKERAQQAHHVMILDRHAHEFENSVPVRINQSEWWYKDDVLGNAGGSLFPLIQQAILDGADELTLVDGYTGETCADDNHYVEGYFDHCRRKPGSEKTNKIMAAGHAVAAEKCKELGIKVNVLGNSIFKECYNDMGS